MDTECIIESTCDLCYECVECCPTGAIGTDCCGALTYVPELCQYCEVCSDVCPSESLKIVQVKE